MIIILKKDKVLTKSDFEKAKEDYQTYIKITIDIGNETLALGGEYHADGEKQLLDMGSKQENIWGGGVDLVSKTIFVNAMVNVRPGRNDSTDILDPKIRNKFLSFTKKALKEYVQ